MHSLSPQKSLPCHFYSCFSLTVLGIGGLLWPFPPSQSQLGSSVHPRVTQTCIRALISVCTAVFICVNIWLLSISLLESKILETGSAWNIWHAVCIEEILVGIIMNYRWKLNLGNNYETGWCVTQKDFPVLPERVIEGCCTVCLENYRMERQTWSACSCEKEGSKLEAQPCLMELLALHWEKMIHIWNHTPSPSTWYSCLPPLSLSLVGCVSAGTGQGRWRTWAHHPTVQGFPFPFPTAQRKRMGDKGPGD